MEFLRQYQQAILVIAMIMLACMAPAVLAQIAPTPPGSCVGAVGATDCSALTGHITLSVAGTLSINEERAISFGNIAVICTANDCVGDATVELDTNGSRTITNGDDSITLLTGADNGGVGDAGAQAPGRYRVTAAGEGNADDTGVYVSFADNAGNPVDFVNEDFWAGNDQNIQVTGTGGEFFTVNDFVFNEDGNDIYGHYINTTNGAGAIDTAEVIVGATLHTDASATTYDPGRYTGTYIVMVSY